MNKVFDDIMASFNELLAYEEGQKNENVVVHQSKREPSMNYAIPSTKPFVSVGPLQRRRGKSEHSEMVRNFCDAHQVTVSIDPATGKGAVNITKRTPR